MEAALLLIAGGAMYIISNQKSQGCEKTKKKIGQETFTNMGAKQNYLPNTDTPPQNYPITNTKQLVNTVQEYVNPNAATDKYFNQEYYEAKQREGANVGNTPQQIFSLSGNYMESSAFKHNNMVPFDGGKIKGYTYDAKIAESVLDNMIGTGSQIFKKVEQAPLFKPQDNMNYIYGTPNHSDFMQSRVNPGLKNNNVKPFESVTVAPGLGLGYGTQGSGGFNSGMEQRDQWLPKTVDELRAVNNPKMEYELNGHEGPSYATILNRGNIGRVEKQKPDTFYIQNQDRWFTTTGAEKGQTLRSIQEMGILKRNDVDVNYSGPAGAGEQQAGYAPTFFEESKRQQTETKDVPHCSAPGCGPEVNNLKLNTYTNYNTNRSSVAPVDTMRSGFSKTIGAVIAPIMDVLKPSRKEEATYNIRVYGNSGSTVASNYVINPNDVTNTTVKETTMYSPNFFINNQKEGQYVNTHQPLEETQRETTNSDYIGGVGYNKEGAMTYDAAYKQTNNDIKAQTIYNRANPGGTQMFNQQMNVNVSRQDQDRFNNRFFTPAAIFPRPPSKENYGNMISPQQYNSQIQLQRNEPSILDAFRKNPYTQSLTTSV
jgi:hypothetical protein